MGKHTMRDAISIKKWHGPQDVVDVGMYVQIKRERQASIQYKGDHAQFRIDPDPESNEYAASRISEIDSRLEVEQRVKRWRPTLDKLVAGKFRVRFTHEQTAVTYNLLLWNAPLKKDRGIPATSIGVTRGCASNFEYSAVIAQNIIANQHTGNLSGDVLEINKLREAANWLCMTEWHWVYVILAENWAQIEVEQGDNRKVVAETRLVKPVEALGFVFSVDNEVFPGRYVPVSAREPEGFDMACFEAGHLQ